MATQPMKISFARRLVHRKKEQNRDHMTGQNFSSNFPHLTKRNKREEKTSVSD